MINLCFDLLAFVSSLQTFQIDNFREPLGMPGPGHWLEPHPRGRLEHPWSLRPGTLRAQKPASLHFLCIVSCLLRFAGFKFTCLQDIMLSWPLLNFISLSSCGSAQAEAPCYLSSTDLSLPYPYCCPRSICPARLDVHTNLIDTGRSTAQSTLGFIHSSPLRATFCEKQD